MTRCGHALLHLRARRGFCDRASKKLGNTTIAPIVHVEFVLRQESAEREAFRQAPVAHQRKALEQIDIHFAGRGGDQSDHLINVVLVVHGDDLRRVLRIDQDYVGASDLEPSQAFTYQQTGWRNRPAE